MSDKSTKNVLTKPEQAATATDDASVTANVATNPTSDTKSTIDFNGLNHVTSKDLLVSGSRGGGKGVLSFSVVHSAKGNGTRIKLSDSLHQALNSPTSLQAVPNKNGTELIIGERLPGASQSFKFSKGKDGKGTTIIYNAGLVKLLIATFNLDYSDGRVSRAFSDVRTESQRVNGEEITYAIVNMVE